MTDMVGSTVKQWGPGTLGVLSNSNGGILILTQNWVYAFVKVFIDNDLLNLGHPKLFLNFELVS